LCFDRALELAPDNRELRASRASMLFELERFEEAARDYEILLEDESAPAWVRGYLTICRCIAVIGGFSRMSARKLPLRWKQGSLPSIRREMPSSPIRCRNNCNARASGQREDIRRRRPCGMANAIATTRSASPIYRRIFRTHATAFLMAGVFEQHDKSRFETVAIFLFGRRQEPDARAVDRRIRQLHRRSRKKATRRSRICCGSARST